MINHLLDEISIESFIESVWAREECPETVVVYLGNTNHVYEDVIQFFNNKKICFQWYCVQEEQEPATFEEVIKNYEPVLKQIEEIAVNYKASQLNMSNLSYGEKLKVLFPGYSGELKELFQPRENPLQGFNRVKLK